MGEFGGRLRGRGRHDRQIPVTSNKTVIGVGTRGGIVGGGFFLGAGTSNVIIRNLTIRDTLVAADDPYYKDTAAQLRQSGSVIVNSSGEQQTGGSAFNPADFSPHALDRAADVPGLVRAQAGPRADIGL